MSAYDLPLAALRVVRARASDDNARRACAARRVITYRRRLACVNPGSDETV